MTSSAEALSIMLKGQQCQYSDEVYFGLNRKGFEVFCAFLVGDTEDVEEGLALPTNIEISYYL